MQTNIDVKRSPSSLTELCQVLGVEYNGRPQAEIRDPSGISPSLYVGMYDDTFNIYLENEKIESCSKKVVMLKLKNILQQPRGVNK